MHHKTEGRFMNQSQEEIAVIGIFALLWVGECSRACSRTRLVVITTLFCSFPHRIQVPDERRYRVEHCQQPQHIRAGIERVRGLAGSV
jgi:hypothetical protein